MFVSPNQAARMLDDFMLGAVMQQDPFLEQFGTLPEEPPDDDPCWDAMPIGDDEPIPTATPIATPTEVHTRDTTTTPTHMEQGLLFGCETMPTIPTKPSPQSKHTKPQSSQDTKPSSTLQLPIYEPHHIPYADFLKMFNGITQLAIYWFNKQNMKE